MAAVKLYVTLVVLLLATCFHIGEGGFGRRWRHGHCTKVNCRWLSWSSWRSCNHYCSKYNMQKRTRSHTSSSCGGSSCTGPSKQIRICSHHYYGGYIIFSQSAADRIPSYCC